MFRSYRLIMTILFLSAILLAGCSSQTTAEPKHSETKMQTLGEKKSKRKVVERDGKYYEIWEQHERLCSDCDR